MIPVELTIVHQTTSPTGVPPDRLTAPKKCSTASAVAAKGRLYAQRRERHLPVSPLLPARLSHSTCDQCDVLTSEPETVAKYVPDTRFLASGIGHIVQVAAGVRRLIVHRRWEHAVSHRQ